MTVYEARDALLRALAQRERDDPGLEEIAVRALRLERPVEPTLLLAATTLAVARGYVDVVGADAGRGQVIRPTPLGWAEGERLLADGRTDVDREASPTPPDRTGDCDGQR